MSSSMMPPPPSPFTHRRTPRLITKHLPLSPPASPESPACILHKMSLSKGATFHYSSSPPTGDDPVLSIPHLTHRSPTCSQSTLTSWLSEKEDIPQAIADFEQTFSGARGKKSSTRRRSALPFEQVRHASVPSDEGLGSSISPASDKGLAKTFERALDLWSNKDSGLGTSVSDSAEKAVGTTSEEDGLVAQDLIQEADSSEPTSRRARQRGGQLSSRASGTITTSAVIQSIAPPSQRLSARHPTLTRFARKKINEYIITPLLNEDRFQDLHPFVTSLQSKANNTVRCLRDLEQSLIFQPLSLAISRQLYRTFGEFTVQLVVDTYQHLSESEQRRATDRPYDNGYFLDLVQQVNQLASHIGSSSRSQQAGTAAEDDEMVYSPSDEVTLEGGLDQTGHIAELVRWRNGKGISLRTGQPYEPTPGMKRQSSDALDEDVARSMARRKKGYIPEIVEMKCSDKSCGKIFTRKCDLAKHEKTHSRPFKCPDENCKYHELGLPTEKERERHYNDKHSSSPLFYKCQFCEFRTKRESNCKQHQEKKHGWHYERAKGKDKAIGSSRMTPAQTPRTPSMDYSPSPAVSIKTWDDTSSISGSIAGSIATTPFDNPIKPMDSYQQTTIHSNPIFPRNSQPVLNTTADDFDFNTSAFNHIYQPTGAYISPSSASSMTTPYNILGTPITPAYSNITEPSPYDTSMAMDIALECNNNNNNNATWDAGLPTPGSFLQAHSRNPSISDYSPLVTGPTTHSFDDLTFMGEATENAPGDFALFGSSGNNAFSNPAAASATLFPTDPEAFAALDNDPMFDQWDDGDFIDYDMNN